MAMAPLWTVNAAANQAQPTITSADGDITIMLASGSEVIIEVDCDLSNSAVLVFIDDAGELIGWNIEDCFPTDLPEQARAMENVGQGRWNIHAAENNPNDMSWWGKCHSVFVGALILGFDGSGDLIGWTYLDCFPTDYTQGDIIVAMSIISSIV